MQTSTQPLPNTINTVAPASASIKLSAAMIEALNRIHAEGEDGLILGTISGRTTIALFNRKLIRTEARETEGGWVYQAYVLTAEGQAAIAPAPLIEETPAVPAATYDVGHKVTFRYFRDPAFKDELYTGEIIAMTFDRLSGWMYRVEPDACQFDLPARWVSASYIKGLYVPVKQASGACVVPYVDGLETLRSIFDLSNEATAAELAGRMTEARALNKEHSRLYDAYMKALKAHADSWKRPVIADVDVTPVLQDDFAPITPNDHPLAWIRPGSLAAKTDWDALKGTRAAQYAEAKARVEANPNRPSPAPTTHDAMLIAEITRSNLMAIKKAMGGGR